MPPSRTLLDPEGYYAQLGVEPSTPPSGISSAYRAKARVLHPDVPKTGNAAAFVALKQAYDVISDNNRRAAYDRAARAAMHNVDDSAMVYVRPAMHGADPGILRHPRFSDMPIVVWLGLAAFLCLCLYQAASRMLTPTQVVNAGIRPNAATVEPLSPSAQRAVLYGPTPVRLAGTPNFYVVPAGTPAVLWRRDATRNELIPLGQIPPFSPVQVVRMIRENGLLEVLVNDDGNGYISADHLTPGNASAARRAYCSFNSGPMPHDGELLERRGYGDARLQMENRAVQPAVVKLRDSNGGVAAAVFLAPGSQVNIDRLPEGKYQAEFAIGEVWSRGCNLFAAGMRARRLNDEVKLPGLSRIIVGSDSAEPPVSDISDDVFQRN